MDDRRRFLALRAHFDERKADLLARLQRTTRHLSIQDLDALATEMTRRQLRLDYAVLLVPQSGPYDGPLPRH